MTVWNLRLVRSINKIACPSATEHYRGTCGTTGTMGCGVPFLGSVEGLTQQHCKKGMYLIPWKGRAMLQSHVDSWGMSWWIERDFLVYPELSISKVWFAAWFARKSSTSEMLLIQIPTPEPLPTDLEMTNDLTRDGENHGDASRSWRERRWCGQQNSKPRNKLTMGVWTHERVPINRLQ